MTVSVLADEREMGRNRHLKLKAAETRCHGMESRANRKNYLETNFSDFTFPTVLILTITAWKELEWPTETSSQTSTVESCTQYLKELVSNTCKLSYNIIIIANILLIITYETCYLLHLTQSSWTLWVNTIIITHFTGEETEDQRSKVACPRSHSLYIRVKIWSQFYPKPMFSPPSLCCPRFPNVVFTQFYTSSPASLGFGISLSQARVLGTGFLTGLHAGFYAETLSQL